MFDGPAECPFCALVSEGRSPVWDYLFRADSTDEIILRSASFLVILDTAPLAEGHLLIITKAHISSLAGLTTPERAELDSVKHDAESLLGRLMARSHFSSMGPRSSPSTPEPALTMPTCTWSQATSIFFPMLLVTILMSSRSHRMNECSKLSPVGPICCSAENRIRFTACMPRPVPPNISGAW